MHEQIVLNPSSTVLGFALTPIQSFHILPGTCSSEKALVDPGEMRIVATLYRLLPKEDASERFVETLAVHQSRRSARPAMSPKGEFLHRLEQALIGQKTFQNKGKGIRVSAF
jgi:hypothetical protein